MRKATPEHAQIQDLNMNKRILDPLRAWAAEFNKAQVSALPGLLAKRCGAPCRSWD